MLGDNLADFTDAGGVVGAHLRRPYPGQSFACGSMGDGPVQAVDPRFHSRLGLSNAGPTRREPSADARRQRPQRQLSVLRSHGRARSDPGGSRSGRASLPSGSVRRASGPPAAAARPLPRSAPGSVTACRRRRRSGSRCSGGPEAAGRGAGASRRTPATGALARASDMSPYGAASRAPATPGRTASASRDAFVAASCGSAATGW